jgi:hypothetical protein
MKNKPNWPKLRVGEGVLLTKHDGTKVKFIREPYKARRSKYDPTKAVTP